MHRGWRKLWMFQMENGEDSSQDATRERGVPTSYVEDNIAQSEV